MREENKEKDQRKALGGEPRSARKRTTLKLMDRRRMVAEGQREPRTEAVLGILLGGDG